jgi:dTDP-4-dehydrorhamnose reductase
VVPITTAEYPTKAKRPANSRLDCSKLETLAPRVGASSEAILRRIVASLVSNRG